MRNRTAAPAPTRHGPFTLLIWVLALLCGFSSYSSAQDPFPGGAASSLSPISGELSNQADFLPVEVAYPLAVERLADDRLLLVWQMPPGYYLYKHAFKFEATTNTQEFELTASFPEFIVREDEFFGRVEVYYDEALIEIGAAAPLLSGSLTVTSQGCADAGLCYPPRTQNFSIDPDGGFTEVQTAPRPVHKAPFDTGDQNTGLFAMLFAAFIGGLILNLMPCVLPILSLKVLSFACSPTVERRRHGRLYSIGVLASFVGIALLLFALRSAGQAIGWGFQLQSPGFVVALAYLFVALGLGLSGVVEFGARFMNLGNRLAERDDPAGSFFTGVLAVVVASPCTAPFMGTALGYALIQPPLTGVLIFLALGAGMALPMLLLAYSDRARAILPKPGPWMAQLRKVLAFPLYATAVWLFWVAGRQAGVDFMGAALLGALFLALGLWLWRSSWVGRSTAILSFALAIGLASWRPADTAANNGGALPEGAIAYSAEKLQALRTNGQPVFVNVTADWCLTCLANKRTVLSAEAVKQAFAETGVTYMVADWTDYDPAIAEFVAVHGRSGIPLYVLYESGKPPQVLPQLLRRQLVIDALRMASSPQIADSGTQALR